MCNLELERFEFMPLIKYNLRSTWRMLLLFLQLSPGMHLIMPHQIELPASLPLPPPSLYLQPCSAYSTIGNDSFSTVSLSRYYCCCHCLCLSLCCCLFSILCSRKNTHSGFIFTFICMQGERGARERSSRVCKFFSKNSLRDNGFSMSHTSLPTSLSTSMPRHTTQLQQHPLPLPPPYPSPDSDNYLHSPIPSPSRCLMFLGHDRWQVSVGVAPCKFFLGTWESSWHVLKCEGNLQLYPPLPLSSHPVCVCALECQKFWLILALRFADLFDDAFFASPALTRSQLEGGTDWQKSLCCAALRYVVPALTLAHTLAVPLARSLA